MSNTVANLKACVAEFDPEALLNDGVNTERLWKQWLENFECCIAFEGVTDQLDAPSKKKMFFLLSTARKFGSCSLHSHQQRTCTKQLRLF